MSKKRPEKIYHSVDPNSKCATCQYSTGYECYLHQFGLQIKEHKKYCNGEKGWNHLEEDKGNSVVR